MFRQEHICPPLCKYNGCTRRYIKYIKHTISSRDSESLFEERQIKILKYIIEIEKENILIFCFKTIQIKLNKTYILY